MNTVRTYVLYDSFGGDVGNGGGAGFWCPRGYGGGKRYSTVLYSTVLYCTVQYLQLQNKYR
jgi:hypothetical protein